MLASCASCWIACFRPATAQAQQIPPDRDVSAPPPARATYVRDHAAAPVARAVRTDQPIDLDGKLDEAAWKTAPPVTDFWHYDPDTGERISEALEVRFLYDQDALYVGAWNQDKQIMKRRVRRDGVTNDSDLFIIYLDTYHDHRTAYRLLVNPSGWRRDLIVSGGGVQGSAGLAAGDISWNPVWQVKIHIGNGEWSVEERIPFSQLRFPSTDEQVWGLQIERKLRPLTEENVWSWTPSTEPGGVGRFGHLVGIRGIKNDRKLEILPYLSGRAEHLSLPRNPAVPFANPLRRSSDYVAGIGADLKYRVSSNLTLDGTLNPDFGQVELDPSVINLTAFETRYADYRPFFVEGAEIFDFGEGGPTVVYSRRIGRAPQGRAPASAVYSNSPETTTILSAAKLTGKTKSGLSIGVFDALTARERATWLGADRAGSRQDVEPRTNYFAGRLRRELRSGQSVLGMLATAVNRSAQGDGLEATMPSAAYAGGIDLKHQFGRRVWELQAHLSPSYAVGTRAAITGLQMASRRYFQRPDAPGPGVDSTATSLFGYQARLAVGKQAGLLRTNVDLLAISPGYEVNDLGFETEAGRLKASFGGGVQHTRPAWHLRNWSLIGTTAFVWNYAGDRIGTEAGINGTAQLNNFHRLSGTISARPALLDDRLTRGGPLSVAPAGFSGSLRYTVDNRTALSGGAALAYSADASGAWSSFTDLTVALRITTSLDASLEPSLSRTYGTAQYVASVRDAYAERTFGRRFVFADLHQTTASLTARLNATLTPDVSLEIYAQPFLSSGRFDRLKELRTSRAFDFGRYGSEIGSWSRTDGAYVIDPDGAGPARPFELVDQDFNVRSMRGNAVFRWEWRPGSTLFLVWQQSRSQRASAEGGQSVGDFDLSRDTRALFRIQPDNIVQLKISYWFNP